MIDGYDAESVPDNLTADRLDSAGYALALEMDVKSINMLETTDGIEVAKNKSAVSDETAYKEVLAAKTYLTRTGVPADGRWMICSPEFMATLMLDTVMLYEKTNMDKWGSEKLDDGQVLSKVRIEPSNQIVRDKNNSEIQLAATLFYDCRNSQPIGINFKVDQIIDFNGQKHQIKTIEPLYDNLKLHHYEIGMVRDGKN